LPRSGASARGLDSWLDSSLAYPGLVRRPSRPLRSLAGRQRSCQPTRLGCHARCISAVELPLRSGQNKVCVTGLSGLASGSGGRRSPALPGVPAGICLCLTEQVMRHKTYSVRAARRGHTLVGRYLQSAYRSGWRRLLRALGFRRPSVMRPGLWSPWRLPWWGHMVFIVCYLRLWLVLVFLVCLPWLASWFVFSLLEWLLP
jgi:hypothetical protein